MNKEPEGKIVEILLTNYAGTSRDLPEVKAGANMVASRIAALMPEPLAVLAARKGYWILIMPPFKEYNQPKWELSLAKNRTYKGVLYSAQVDTYSEAESLAREYLEKLEDVKK